MFERGTGSPPKSWTLQVARDVEAPITAVTAPPSTADELAIGHRELCVVCLFPTAERSATSALSFPCVVKPRVNTRCPWARAVISGHGRYLVPITEVRFRVTIVVLHRVK